MIHLYSSGDVYDGIWHNSLGLLDIEAVTFKFNKYYIITITKLIINILQNLLKLIIINFNLKTHKKVCSDTGCFKLLIITNEYIIITEKLNFIDKYMNHKPLFNFFLN